MCFRKEVSQACHNSVAEKHHKDVSLAKGFDKTRPSVGMIDLDIG